MSSLALASQLPNNHLGGDPCYQLLGSSMSVDGLKKVSCLIGWGWGEGCVEGVPEEEMGGAENMGC